MNKQQIAESLLQIAKNNLAYLEPDIDLEDEDNEDLWVPVRLRCYRDNDLTLRTLPSNHCHVNGNPDPDNVSIEILSGNSQFDTDHRGWWGSDSIHATADIEAALEVASNLMDEVEDEVSVDLPLGKRSIKEVKASFEPSRFGIAPMYAWDEASKCLCFVTVKDGGWWFPSVSGLDY